MMVKKYATNVEEGITGIALFIMVILVIINVFCRLFLNKSVAWADEISYICYAYVIFVGSSCLYKRFGHSAVDLVVRAFPEKLQAICSVFSTIILTVTNAFCFALSCGFCVSSWTRKTQILKMPYSVQAFALVLSFGLMTLHSIMFLKNIFKKRDYFHKIPIYENIYNVDALEDQIQAGLDYQKEKSEKGGDE